jgi:hypothetical protein
MPPRNGGEEKQQSGDAVRNLEFQSLRPVARANAFTRTAVVSRERGLSWRMSRTLHNTGVRCSYNTRLMSRRMSSKTTAPMNATKIDAIKPPSAA